MSFDISPSEESTPQTKRKLSDRRERQNDCQTGGGVHTPLSVPWRGEQRQDDKTRIWRYVRHESAGVRFSKLVRDVFGRDTVNSAGADYRTPLRFVKGCEYFKTDKRDEKWWVEPSLSAFNLSPQYVYRKTAGQSGDRLSNGESGRKTGDNGRADSRTDGVDGSEDTVEPPEPQYPKDRANGVLSKRTVLDESNGGHDYRQGLLRELATERDLQADKYQVFERIRGTGEDHLLIPYLTRFNSRDKATDTRDRFRTALRQAAESYQDAVVMELTPDPKRHDSLTAALESLSENKNRLLSWLATEYQLGYRPENLTVLEFMENGLPHYHVVLFGVSWLMDQRALAAKWNDLGTGSIVYIRTAKERGGKWIIHNDGGTVTIRQYLGKTIRDLVDLAGMDNDDLQDAVDAGNVEDLWKHALYWATERQYCSCSPGLKRSTDDGLPHITRWRFRGVSTYQDIPAHVRQDAVVLSRGQPPPASRMAPTADSSQVPIE